jgi:hypothetical protein
LRFGAASRDEALEQRVLRQSCQAATAGWFRLELFFGPKVRNALAEKLCETSDSRHQPRGLGLSPTGDRGDPRI